MRISLACGLLVLGPTFLSAQANGSRYIFEVGTELPQGTLIMSTCLAISTRDSADVEVVRIALDSGSVADSGRMNANPSGYAITLLRKNGRLVSGARSTPGGPAWATLAFTSLQLLFPVVREGVPVGGSWADTLPPNTSTINGFSIVMSGTRTSTLVSTDTLKILSEGMTRTSRTNGDQDSSSNSSVTIIVFGKDRLVSRAASTLTSRTEMFLKESGATVVTNTVTQSVLTRLP